MVNNPKFFVIIFCAVIAVVSANRFYDYYVEKNFEVVANTICNPVAEDCFVYDCSVADSECDPTPFKKVTLHASHAPQCLFEHSCNEFFCSVESIQSHECEIAYCNDENLEDGEVCMERSVDSADGAVVTELDFRPEVNVDN